MLMFAGVGGGMQGTGRLPTALAWDTREWGPGWTRGHQETSTLNLLLLIPHLVDKDTVLKSLPPVWGSVSTWR